LRRIFGRKDKRRKPFLRLLICPAEHAPTGLNEASYNGGALRALRL
jgi:hypothetical protein